MKQYLQILALWVIACSIVFISVNFPRSNDIVGSSITTINGTDRLTDSRTTINDNFTALNNGKIEISTTSLPLITTLAGLTSASSLSTIGTIVSGIWHGTILQALYGGTGWGYIRPYAVMVGNGSNSVATTTPGTDGQLLTYSSTTTPYWASPAIDTTQNYSWSGVNTGIGITGEIIAYASSTAPTGWLLCNGQSVSTTTYSTLFSLVGYQYGGSGANFNVPDMRGRQIVMASSSDPAFDVLGETGGATTTTLTVAQMPSHSHNTATQLSGGGTPAVVPGSAGSVGSIATDAQGGGQAHSNLDPYIVMYYIIKY